MKFWKVLAAVAGLAVIVGTGLLIGWFATRDTHPQSMQPPSQHETVLSASTSPPPAQAAANHAPPPRPAPPVARTNAAPTPVLPRISHVAAHPQNSTNWEDKLDDILASDTDDTNKVKQLFLMFPQLPEDGQEEVVQHLSNLVEDENYGPLGDLLKNAKLPETVLDALMSDLLNRPDATKLPMFLDIARNPDHAKAGEARDLLELYLDEDYGNDWDKWQKAVKDYLSKNQE